MRVMIVLSCDPSKAVKGSMATVFGIFSTGSANRSLTSRAMAPEEWLALFLKSEG